MGLLLFIHLFIFLVDNLWAKFLKYFFMFPRKWKWTSAVRQLSLQWLAKKIRELVFAAALVLHSSDSWIPFLWKNGFFFLKKKQWWVRDWSWCLTLVEPLGSLFFYFDHVAERTVRCYSHCVQRGNSRKLQPFLRGRKFIKLLLGMWMIDKDKSQNNLCLELLFYSYGIKVVGSLSSSWDRRECKHSSLVVRKFTGINKQPRGLSCVRNWPGSEYRS